MNAKQFCSPNLTESEELLDWRGFGALSKEWSVECNCMFVHHGSEAIVTDGEQERLHLILHELSNVMTGVLMSGGLLRLALRGDEHEHHAADICEGGERGAELVREARSLLPAPLESLSGSAVPIDYVSGESMSSNTNTREAHDE